MLLAKIICIPTRLYSRLQFPQSMPWYWSILLIFSIIVAALLPGFAILGFYQSIILTMPIAWSLSSLIFYVLKFGVSTIAMLSSIVIYTDITFPLIMHAFGAIFSRTDF